MSFRARNDDLPTVGLTKLDSRSILAAGWPVAGDEDDEEEEESPPASPPRAAAESPNWVASLVLKLAAVAWNLPRALLRALLAAVVGEEEPLLFPAVAALARDVVSAEAAITAATASTSMPGGGDGGTKDRVGMGGPLGKATAGVRWVAV